VGVALQHTTWGRPSPPTAPEWLKQWNVARRKRGQAVMRRACREITAEPATVPRCCRLCCSNARKRSRWEVRAEVHTTHMVSLGSSGRPSAYRHARNTSAGIVRLNALNSAEWHHGCTNRGRQPAGDRCPGVLSRAEEKVGVASKGIAKGTVCGLNELSYPEI